MYQIDVTTASATLPTPAAAGTPGYFTDGNVALGIQPTIVPADFMNMLMEELLNVLAAVGLTPSKTTYNQLVTAIEQLVEARAGNYVVDTGVANAYVVALSPAVTAYSNGLSVKFRATHSNTGASTLNAGAGAAPLLRDDGTALQSGDIPPNGIVSCTYDAAAGGFLVNSIVPSQLGQLAKENIGQGLEDDGGGNLRVKVPDGSLRRTAAGLQSNEPITSLAGPVVLGAANHFANFVGAGTLNLAQASTLWNGFCFAAMASGGSVTLNPNAADGFNGGGAGSAYTLQSGASALFICDGAGNWWVFNLTTPVSAQGGAYNAAFQSGFVL